MGEIQTVLIAIAVTAFLVEVARRLAPIVGLVDKPTERKSHKGEIPLVGGLAIFLGLVVTLALTGMLQQYVAFVVAALAMVIVGVWDDVRTVSPPVRMLVQGSAVLCMAYFGDAVLLDIGHLKPNGDLLELGWFAIPFTIFAGIGLINAFNMSDGVDGLCGTFALIALIALGVMSGIAGRQEELTVILLLAGGLVGFLLFNARIPGRSQAKVFLGDAGSYLIGLAVLFLTIRLSQGPDRAIAPVSALWFCMLPLFDTVGMILRRLRRGRSPFSPDREHIHHVFLLAKFTVSETWIGLTIVALSGMSVGIVWSVTEVSEKAILGFFLVAAFLYYWMIMRAWKVMRFLSRSINRRAGTTRDRRVGTERRVRASIYYENGIPVERRSGKDRRADNIDRRHPEEEVPSDNVVAISRKKESVRPGNRAARTS